MRAVVKGRAQETERGPTGSQKISSSLKRGQKKGRQQAKGEVGIFCTATTGYPAKCKKVSCFRGAKYKDLVPIFFFNSTRNAVEIKKVKAAPSKGGRSVK